MQAEFTRWLNFELSQVLLCSCKLVPAPPGSVFSLVLVTISTDLAGCFDETDLELTTSALLCQTLFSLLSRTATKYVHVNRG